MVQNIFQEIKVVSYKGELIPIWDKRISFEENDFYGDSVTFNPDEKSYTNQRVELKPALLNLVTKEIVTGIEVVINSKPEFVIDQEVYYEESHRLLGESKIKEIKYNILDNEIIRYGKDMDSYYQNVIPNFNPNIIYHIKYYKPSYILENDKVIDWSHQLFKKLK